VRNLLGTRNQFWVRIWKLVEETAGEQLCVCQEWPPLSPPSRLGLPLSKPFGSKSGLRRPEPGPPRHHLFRAGGCLGRGATAAAVRRGGAVRRSDSSRVCAHDKTVFPRSYCDSMTSDGKVSFQKRLPLNAKLIFHFSIKCLCHSPDGKLF